MGKKGSWISAIKRLFRSNANPLNNNNNNNNEAHKKRNHHKARGRFKHGGSFFPFCREPSSIEQILGEIDQHYSLNPTAQPQTQPQPSSSSSSTTPVSPQRRLISPPRVVVHQHPKPIHKPEPTLQQCHLSATRIQAAYRGYMARRKAPSLAGLVRLQRVVTSKSVKRQTVTAMKQMQLLVRVQTQIQSRRMQMLENQAVKPQPNKNNPCKQSDEHWDDSLITKEEREARLQRKADAAIKRERAMAYAYSRQLWKDKTPTTSAHKMGGYPWWWKWLERQLPYPTPKNQHFASTPSSHSYKQLDMPTTPMSSRSTNRLMRARKGASSFYPIKDDDSLRSCPPLFSVPNYMSPTASARAKERCATPASESSTRRFSLPCTPASSSIGGDLSMDSSSSVGRKPFNRFV